MHPAKLYVAVRADLPVGVATAQAVHAAFLFSNRHPDLARQWMKDSQYLVVVTVPDEVALIALTSRAHAEDLPFALWHEPDMAGAATALSLAPGDHARRLCANLPLFGREMSLV